MFNREYRLRRTKMVIYQIAMILCVISESVGAAALSDYVDQQDGISTRSRGRALVQNNDFIGITSYNILLASPWPPYSGAPFSSIFSSPKGRKARLAYIMWKSIWHDEQFGPKSSKYRTKGEEGSIEMAVSNPTATVAPTPISEPIRPYTGT
ncbi:hypothetical protein G7Y89_g7103 [Cudoniella acicularis]|uniref:Uncharacterized protein n=1 Tax=Cudoniella acicularis TaxID=354080 RepID=A0A8H4RLF8_9HELO|nr:hypothetical protein G7Y89_g7103 [Cudoniella acicularis]